jgi:drug/metabolite transporter (DMT)-like permease
MAVALLGVVLVITKGDPGSILHGQGHGGDLLVFIGAACWVVYTLGARTRFPDFSPLRYTTLTAATGTLTIVAVTAVVTLAGAADVPSVADVTAVWWQVIYIFAAGAVIAVLAWNEGVRRIGPANGALFMNLVPVVAFAIAIAGGYRPGAFELAGAVLTIAALTAANLAGRRSASADAVPVEARAGGDAPPALTARV